MKYRLLGNTDLQVSAIGLGTMTWGEQNSEQQAHAQLDLAVAQGVNFIDTAELYPVPPKQETQGCTESFIGSWLEKRKGRDQVIIATKIAGKADWADYFREGKNCFNRENIFRAVEGSLRRLKTDYIDLYQLHWPERTTNFFGTLGYSIPKTEQDLTSIYETLSVLNEVVASGKIRYIGISNETPWGVSECLRVHEKHGFPRIASIQNPYNLLNRSFEIGLAEFAHREHVGLLAYSPLAFGVLSGKYQNGARPAGARLTLFSHFSRYATELAFSTTEQYLAVAKKYDLDLDQMALAYVNSRPFVTSNLIGATNIEQLTKNIASINVELAPSLLEEIEAIHNLQSNPCP